MQKVWEIKEKISGEFLEGFAEYSPLTLQLLWNRNLKTQEAIDEFFNPDYDEDLHDPFLLFGMDRAVSRINQAIKGGEKILVFGDYDHDGVSGAALLHIFFREIGADSTVMIPDRLQEGYGLSQKSIKEIISQRVNLLITVDCGITDYEEIKRARDSGIDVIVLDHHLVYGEPPPAYAIVNPKQKEDTYPFKELTGAGIAFKVVEALLRRKTEKVKARNFPEGWEKWLLDLVTISTIGDIVPLLGENRTLVKYGLVVLSQTRREGLKALMACARITPRLQKNLDPTGKLPITNLDTSTVAFSIVPRINAASRMDHADTAFLLLTTDSYDEAHELAGRLEGHNRDRQAMVEKIMKDVEARLSQLDNLPTVIIEGSSDWSRGLLGIVANKILDKYFRPAFIFSQGSGQSVGSVRVMEGFHVVEAMESCKELFEEFGGHKHAGGFTIKNENLEKFKEAMRDYARKTIGENGFSPRLEIEMELDPQDVNWELYDEVERFAPFGEANPEPLFLIRNLEIRELRRVGKNGKHTQLVLQTAGSSPTANKNFRAIYFNGDGETSRLSTGDRIDVVFEFIADEWNGTRELKLKIIDLRPITS